MGFLCKDCGSNNCVMTKQVCHRNVSYVHSKMVRKVSKGNEDINEKLWNFIEKLEVGEIINMNTILSLLQIQDDTNGDLYRSRMNYLVCIGYFEKLDNKKNMMSGKRLEMKN